MKINNYSKEQIILFFQEARRSSDTVRISNTQQLRDFADYAHVKDLKMELFVRPNTRVAKSILEAGWDIKYLW